GSQLVLPATTRIQAPASTQCTQCTQRARETRDLLSARSLRTIGSSAPVQASRDRVELLAGNPKTGSARSAPSEDSSQGFINRIHREWGQRGWSRWCFRKQRFRTDESPARPLRLG